MGFHGDADGRLEGAGEELGGLSERGSGKEVFGRHGPNGLRSEMQAMRLTWVWVCCAMEWKILGNGDESNFKRRNEETQRASKYIRSRV